jgi:hypothetical protein
VNAVRTAWRVAVENWGIVLLYLFVDLILFNLPLTEMYFGSGALSEVFELFVETPISLYVTSGALAVLSHRIRYPECPRPSFIKGANHFFWRYILLELRVVFFVALPLGILLLGPFYVIEAPAPVWYFFAGLFRVLVLSICVYAEAELFIWNHKTKRTFSNALLRVQHFYRPAKPCFILIGLSTLTAYIISIASENYGEGYLPLVAFTLVALFARLGPFLISCALVVEQGMIEKEGEPSGEAA